MKRLGVGKGGNASKVALRTLEERTARFLENAKVLHGNKYDYSNVIFKNNYTKVMITCVRCGNSFLQTPFHHLHTKGGCTECGKYRKGIGGQNIDPDTYFKRAHEIYGDKYDYSECEFQGQNRPITIRCPTHGLFTLAAAVTHLSVGRQCRVCYVKSSPESIIQELLDKKNIEYEYQKTFPNLRAPHNGYALSYDFYIPSLRMIIEFDGPQHFTWMPHLHRTKQEFKKLQRYDRLKNKFAINNGLRMERIHHKNVRQLPEIIDKLIS